jgi:hypothetical protein
VAGAADAAKEEAAAQVNLLAGQLAAAQARVGEAEKVRLVELSWGVGWLCGSPEHATA